MACCDEPGGVVSPQCATAGYVKGAVYHRNTLEYRLNRISELTGLDLVILMTGCCCMWRCSWMKSGSYALRSRRRWLIPLSPKGRGNVRVNRQFGIIYALVFPDRLNLADLIGYD